MIVARWKIDAKFGRKNEVMESINYWMDEIGTQIGFDSNKSRMMTGSIGANESCVVMEVEMESLSQLEESWDQMREMDEHAQWSKDLEPNIVSGSHRWEIYRLN